MSYSPNFRGSSFNGPSRATATGYTNGTIITISKATPVSSNTSGQMVFADVSNEASIQALLGLCVSDTPTGAAGTVVNAGRLENVTTGFSVGDPIYVGVGGTLTNQKPSPGVAGFAAGDFVVFLGVLVTNEFNPSLQDIQIMISIIGEL